MALKETLRLVVEADTRGAVKGIENVGKAADKTGKSTKDSLDKVGAGFTKVGAGMIGFGAIALAGLGGLAKMSEDANLSTVKLQNTLDNMPKLAGENAKQFTDLAKEIQGYTAADADAIVEAEAMLGTFNLTADQIKRITPLVVDYSRKFGVDMVSAATQVGKALDGNVGALKRNGVSIDEAAFKADHFTAVQEALSNQVGGFAKAEGETFAGSLERMKNQLGDLAEGVGGGAVDAFTKMFGAVGRAAGALEKISPGAQNAAGQIATFGAVGLIAVGGVSTLIGKLIEARRNFGVAAEGAKLLTAKLGGLSGIARLAASSAGLVGLAFAARELGDALSAPRQIAGLSELENSLLDFVQTGKAGGAAAKVLGEDMGSLSGAFRRVTDKSIQQGLTDLAQKVPLVGGDVKSLRAAKGRIDELDKALATLATRDPSAAAEAFDEITRGLRDQGISADTVRGQFDDYRGAVADADTTNRTAKGGIDANADAQDGLAESTKTATDKIKEQQDAVRAVTDPLFGLQDALQKNVDAQGDVSAKQLEAAAAQQAYTEAVQKFGPKSKEAVDAYFKMTDAQRGLSDANRDAVRSAQDVEFAIGDLRAEVEDNPAALDQAKRKLREWQAQGLITAAQADKTSREFDQLAGSIKKVPGAKTIRVTAHGTEGAKTKILRVRDALGQLHDKTLTIGVTTALGAQAAQIMSSKMFAGQFAEGGEVPGPRGAPKVAIVHGGEKILSLEDQAKMTMRTHNFPTSMAGTAAAGGGGGQVNVNVNILGEGLMRYLRNQVRVEYGGDVQAALGTPRR